MFKEYKYTTTKGIGIVNYAGNSDIAFLMDHEDLESANTYYIDAGLFLFDDIEEVGSVNHDLLVEEVGDRQAIIVGYDLTDNPDVMTGTVNDLLDDHHVSAILIRNENQPEIFYLSVGNAEWIKLTEVTK